MKIFVFAPDYTHRSGGIATMHYLMYLLQRAGHLVITCAKKYNPDFDLRPEFRRGPEKTDDMIIAPEITFLDGVYHLGLPVLRWVLYFPGKNGGPAHYPEDEIVYHWSEEYRDSAIEASFQKSSKEFNLPLLTREEFSTKGIIRGKETVFLVRKGRNMKKHPDGAFEMTDNNPPERRHMLRLFKEYKTLYCYDRFTSIITEALLSGMNVLIWDYDNNRWEKAVLTTVKFRDYGSDTAAVLELLNDFEVKKAGIPGVKSGKYRNNTVDRIRQFLKKCRVKLLIILKTVKNHILSGKLFRK